MTLLLFGFMFNFHKFLHCQAFDASVFATDLGDLDDIEDDDDAGAGAASSAGAAAAAADDDDEEEEEEEEGDDDGDGEVANAPLDAELFEGLDDVEDD